MNYKIINFILFQIGWFACVLSAAGNSPVIGLSIAAMLVTVHLYLSDHKARESILILAICLIGFSWDSVLVKQEQFIYAHSDFSSLAPLWIAAMWAMFATTINSSLSWLKGRYLLASLLGAVFGPIAYFSASKLGAVNLVQDSNALLLQAIAWSVFMPGMILLANFIYKTENSVFLEIKE